jgi:hypothetical protein
MINNSLTKGYEILIRHVTLHPINPLVTPDKIIQIGQLIWMLRTRIQMIYTGILPWNERHASIKADEVGILKLLKQSFPKGLRDRKVSCDILNEVITAIVAFMIPFFPTSFADTLFHTLLSSDCGISSSAYILLFSARSAKNSFIVSLCPASIAQVCSIPFLSQMIFSLSSPFCILFCTRSTENRCTIIATRLTTIFTQTSINPCLLRFVICHFSYLHRRILCLLSMCLWRHCSTYHVKSQVFQHGERISLPLPRTSNACFLPRLERRGSPQAEVL